MLEVYVDGVISLVEFKIKLPYADQIVDHVRELTSATTWCKVHPYSFGLSSESRWDYVTRPPPSSSDASAVGNLL